MIIEYYIVINKWIYNFKYKLHNCTILTKVYVAEKIKKLLYKNV